MPELPAMAAKVMEALENSEVDYTLLEKKISKDPVLMVRVCRLRTQPFIVFSGKINSLEQACIYLGVHIMRNIVMSSCIMNSLHKS